MPIKKSPFELQWFLFFYSPLFFLLSSFLPSLFYSPPYTYHLSLLYVHPIRSALSQHATIQSLTTPPNFSWSWMLRILAWIDFGRSQSYPASVSRRLPESRLQVWPAVGEVSQRHLLLELRYALKSIDHLSYSTGGKESSPSTKLQAFVGRARRTAAPRIA